MPLLSETERGKLVYAQWLSRLEAALRDCDVSSLLPKNE